MRLSYQYYELIYIVDLWVYLPSFFIILIAELSELEKSYKTSCWFVIWAFVFYRLLYRCKRTWAIFINESRFRGFLSFKASLNNWIVDENSRVSRLQLELSTLSSFSFETWLKTIFLCNGYYSCNSLFGRST